MDKRILIIDESKLFREYLKVRLEDLGFEITAVSNGFDGLIKMRNETPDLIISDYFLKKIGLLEFLKEKKTLKTTVNIPIIVVSQKIEKHKIEEIARYNIYKYLSKPIKIDSFFNIISHLFKMKIQLDLTPSMVDVHLNENIVFLEISNGLNIEKINLLRFKLLELVQLYELINPKILIIFTALEIRDEFSFKLKHLFDIIIETLHISTLSIKILTKIEEVQDFMDVYPDYKAISIFDDFVSAIEELGKIEVSLSKNEIEKRKQLFLQNTQESDKQTESIELQFTRDNLDQNIVYKIAIIDDDLPVLEFLEMALSHTGWVILTYTNGKEFIEDYKKNTPDLIFLDLLMPEMNGFQVMEELNKNSERIPIIIVSALTQREMVIRARKQGAMSYMPKPLNPKFIVKKAQEILNSNF